MNRSLILLAAVAVLAAGSSCRRSTASQEMDGTSLGVSHVVICWLKRPGSYEDRQRVLHACRTLIGWMIAFQPASAHSVDRSSQPM